MSVFFRGDGTTTPWPEPFHLSISRICSFNNSRTLEAFSEPPVSDRGAAADSSMDRTNHLQLHPFMAAVQDPGEQPADSILDLLGRGPAPTTYWKPLTAF